MIGDDDVVARDVFAICCRRRKIGEIISDARDQAIAGAIEDIAEDAIGAELFWIESSGPGTETVEFEDIVRVALRLIGDVIVNDRGATTMQDQIATGTERKGKLNSRCGTAVPP